MKVEVEAVFVGENCDSSCPCLHMKGPFPETQPYCALDPKYSLARSIGSEMSCFPKLRRNRECEAIESKSKRQ